MKKHSWKYYEYYKLKGFIEGPAKRFNARNLTLEFGRRSQLEGYISMYGLPDVEETFINAKINKSTIHVGDLDSYISEDASERLQKFGIVKLAGRFSGFTQDFVCKANFETHIGEFDTDINLKVGETDSAESSYSGSLVTKNFDLGVLMGDTTLYQYLDLDGSINGSGFTRSDAKS